MESGTLEEPLEGEHFAAAQAVPLRHATREHIVQLRKELGLRSDAEFVESLHRSPESHAAVHSDHTAFGRLFVTEDELPRLRQRFRLGSRASDVERSAKRLTDKAFAGIVLTHRKDGSPMLRVLTTAAGESAVSSLPDAVDAELAGSVEVEVVEHSEQQLIAAEEKVAAFLQKLGTQGEVNGTSVNIEQNRVDVHLYQPKRNFEALARAELGQLPIAWLLESEPAGPNYRKNQLAPYAIVEAGLAIHNDSDNSSCTSGFAVANGYGEFLLSAGHCGDINDQFSQGGWRLGRVGNSVFRGAADVLAVSTSGVRAAWGRAHLNVNNPNEPVTASMGINGDVNGQMVCQTGFATTGMTGLEGGLSSCGTLRSRAHRPTWVPGALAVFRRAGYASTNGDSGAGVLFSSMYGFLAAGIHSGSSSGNGVYTHMPYALAEMNVVMDAWQ